MKNKSAVLLIIFAVGIAAVIFLSRGKETVQPQKATVGLAAPGFELKDTSGKIWRLSDLRGKVVMLNFWASWCDSCKEENPSLNSLVSSLKGNSSFVFLSTLYRDEPARGQDYLRKNGFDFPIYIDDKDAWASYGLTGVPETYIIGKDGILKKKVIGPMRWDTPDIRAFMEKLIND